MISKTTHDVTEVWVKFLLPFSVDLPNGTYPVRSSGFICTIQIRKKLTRDNASGMRGGMHISDDRFGLTNHTFVVCRFVFNNPIKQDRISKLQLKHFSLDAINLLLNNCRWQTNEYYNHDIVSQDLARTEYLFLDSSDIMLPIDVFVIGGGGAIKMNTSGFTIDESSVSIVRNNLLNGIILPFEIELIKNSVDYLRFKNYRMSCIEIETAIEIIISNIIVNYLTTLQKTDPNQVTAYLQSSRITNATIIDFPSYNWDIIKPVLRRATFDAITASTEYQNWMNKCRCLRHRVVHAGYSPSDSETENSLKSGIEFFKVLLPYEKSLANCNFSIILPTSNNAESILENQANLYNIKLADFKDITSIDFNKIKTKIEEAKDLLSKEKYDDAISAYSEVLKEDPLNVDVLIDKGYALQKKGDNRTAIDCYEKAIEIDSKEKTIFNNLGTAFTAENNLPRANEAYKNAILIDPDFTLALRNRGFLLLQQNNIDEAMACIIRFTEIEPYKAESWYCLAIVYAVKDEKEKCFFNLEKAIKIDNKIKQMAAQDSAFQKYSAESQFQTLIS